MDGDYLDGKRSLMTIIVLSHLKFGVISSLDIILTSDKYIKLTPTNSKCMYAHLQFCLFTFTPNILWLSLTTHTSRYTITNHISTNWFGSKKMIAIILTGKIHFNLKQKLSTLQYFIYTSRFLKPIPIQTRITTSPHALY